GLLDSLHEGLLPGQRVLLPRGDLAREVLPRELALRGLVTVEIDVYETVIEDDQDEDVLQLLIKRKVDVITFASSSTVTNLITVMQRMGVDNPVDLLQSADIACIGPLTAKT
ncbi:uroporphyrinogen-III synthase, partial [Paenibacillus sepulcri]|nr:uroporphyrinogen-III synthase [Paenibacillus sepulcri]